MMDLYSEYAKSLNTLLLDTIQTDLVFGRAVNFSLGGLK
jgi:hypothetical protein